MKSTNGERLIAAVETFKEILVLLAGFGLIGLIHHDVTEFAEKLIQHLHLDPTGHYPHIFLEVANNTSSAKLWGLASLVFAYAVVRLLEGYGLWNNMSWAKWLAAVSGGIYVPFEAYKVITKFSWLKFRNGRIRPKIFIDLYEHTQSHINRNCLILKEYLKINS